MQFFFLNNLIILNDIDGDVVIDKSEDIKIQGIDRTLDFDDVFFTHFITFCIFDNSNRTVKLL